MFIIRVSYQFSYVTKVRGSFQVMKLFIKLLADEAIYEAIYEAIGFVDGFLPM